MITRAPRIEWQSRYAFTLIEVLVVVAIIVLLVAVLVPSLTRAREQAKRVVCASNQHQIIAGVQMYASEHNGYVPPSIPAFNASITWIVRQLFAKGYEPPYPTEWVHLGILYKKRIVPDPQTFFCPSYTEFPHCWPRGWYEFASYGGLERVATSYIYAVNGQVDWYPKGARYSIRLSELKHEALFADVFVSNGSKSQRKGIWAHVAGINASFADGATQLVRVKPDYALQAVSLYDHGNIDEKDYFTWCFFKLLSGERNWIEAFPSLPPGVTK
jgi:prepilin-type N-terminal cleavage/methylation domain-containing protein